jgi:hypothetical protein
MIGDREPIDDRRLHPNTKLELSATQMKEFVSIKLKPPGSRARCQAQEAMVFYTVLSPFLKLDFMDGDVNPVTKHRHNLHANGLTCAVKTNDIRIWLAFQDVIPLLRNDLTSSQRLAEELSIAQTLLHEFMHAYNIANDLYNQIPEAKEPYFEDECCRELGYSAENAFFGGVAEGFIRSRTPRPHLGFFFENWPDDTHVLGSVLLDPTLSLWKAAAPIPVSYYEMLASKDFWSNQFRSFGIIRTESAKVAVQQRADPNYEWIVLSRTEEGRVFQNQKPDPVTALLRMSPAERIAYDERMKAAGVAKIAELLGSRNSAVRMVVSQGELCERYKGPPEHMSYTVEVEELIDRLEVMLQVIMECVKVVKEVEAGGEERIGKRLRAHPII